MGQGRRAGKGLFDYRDLIFRILRHQISLSVKFQFVIFYSFGFYCVYRLFKSFAQAFYLWGCLGCLALLPFGKPFLHLAWGGRGALLKKKKRFMLEKHYWKKIYSEIIPLFRKFQDIIRFPLFQWKGFERRHHRYHYRVGWCCPSQLVTVIMPNSTQLNVQI